MNSPFQHKHFSTDLNDRENVKRSNNYGNKRTKNEVYDENGRVHKLKELSVVLTDCDNPSKKKLKKDSDINVVEDDLKKLNNPSKDVSIVLEDCMKATSQSNEVLLNSNGLSPTEPTVKFQKSSTKRDVNDFVNRPKRCTQCAQFITNKLITLPEDDDEIDEETALQTATLFIDGVDPDKYYKLTNFTVHDKFNHVCAFDTGLIEKGKRLYVVGYIKPVWDEGLDDLNGVRASLGPICQWWVAGFDGGKHVLVGISTEAAHYYLKKPSEVYEPTMKVVIEKTYLAKLVIEFLENKEDTTYENLVHYLEDVDSLEGYEKLSEDKLLYYAQFVIEQIETYDSAADDDESALIQTECMKQLIELTGISTEEKSRSNCVIRTTNKEPRKGIVALTPTTTPIVRNVFSNCTNENIEDEYQTVEIINRSPINTRNRINLEPPHCKWIGSGKLSSFGGKRKFFYDSVVIDGQEFSCGDCVLVHADDFSNAPVFPARIINMWDSVFSKKLKFFHAHLFTCGANTVLGDVASEDEIFIVDQCENFPLTQIKCKCEIEFKHVPANWSSLGGQEVDVQSKTVNKFIYGKLYEPLSGRFEDPPKEYTDYYADGKEIGYCDCCHRSKTIAEQNEVQLSAKFGGGGGEDDYEFVKWRNEEYKTGGFVLIQPDAFEFNRKQIPEVKNKTIEEVDEDIYPEYYRKSRPRDMEFPDPYKIGFIVRIYCSSYDANDIQDRPEAVKLQIQKMYRPENTHLGITASYHSDLHKLYWSEEGAIINLTQVQGRCFVNYCEDTSKSQLYWDAGANHFYFHDAYDAEKGVFTHPPKNICLLLNKLDISRTNENVLTPLRAMDVFAGCGGLSEGLHQAGFSRTDWAVEYDEPAATAFKSNNPDCHVFIDNCNELLQLMIDGKMTNSKGQILPTKGDVEVLCGGPPCQGFSRLNRNTKSISARNNNSLIATYLSYCDFFRPRFFLLENIRNFSTFEESLHVRRAFKCLLDMGYQITFGLLQAGSFAVPQKRNRFFIIAAAPGEVLPNFPEPLTVTRSLLPVVVINSKRYVGSTRNKESAPYRHLTTRDAIADLPPIQSGASKQVLPYLPKIQSHYQKMLHGRHKKPVIYEHICQNFSLLMQARIALVPCKPHADWRDLPNIELELEDGTITNKLDYWYNDSKHGYNRGVCPCAERPANKSTKCNKLLRPTKPNTLIPFHLAHSANQNTNWPGLYARLSYDEQFHTTVTCPSPGSSPGYTIHPEQDRIISVRECARSQGFPDSFKFFGTAVEKHKQIGNAVPPPLARAIATEMKKSYLQNHT